MTLYSGIYKARQGVDAHGVLLVVRNATSVEIGGETPTWLPVAQVVDMKSPSMSKSFHDVTPAIPGTWKQAVPGYKDPGTVTFTLLYEPALGSHSYLLTSFQEDRLESFRIFIDTNSYWGFTGYVGGIATSYGAGNIISGSISIRLTGEVNTGTMELGSIWPGVTDTLDPDSDYQYVL